MNDNTETIVKPKMPKAVPFIIGNEAAERFSFYGIRSILATFLVAQFFNPTHNPALTAFAEAKSNGGTYAPLKSKRIKDIEGNIKLLDVPKRIKPWWFTAQNGKVCLILRYGSKALEIAQGKTAIELDKANELIPTLQKIKAAVEAGELDHLIDVATEAVKLGFKH